MIMFQELSLGSYNNGLAPRGNAPVCLPELCHRLWFVAIAFYQSNKKLPNDLYFIFILIKVYFCTNILIMSFIVHANVKPMLSQYQYTTTFYHSNVTFKYFPP